MDAPLLPARRRRPAPFAAVAVAAAAVACAASSEPAMPVAQATDVVDTVDTATADSSGGDAPTAPLAPAPADISRLWVAIEDLPESLVGADAQGQPLRWAVPVQGFRVDVHADAAGDPLTPPQIQAIGPAGAVALTGGGPWVVAGKKTWRWSVEVAAGAIGAGPCELRAAAAGRTGALVVEVAERTPAIDPFESEDPWLLVLSRDAGSLTASAAGEAVAVTVGASPDGIADFDQSLAVVGLQGGDAAWNAGLRALFRERLRGWLHQLFRRDPVTGGETADGIRVRILFEGDGALAAIDAKLLSKMAIGGPAPPSKDGKAQFGLATIDLRNTGPNDDSKPGLGVFTFSLVKAALEQPAAVAILAPVLPALGGKPFGSLPGDAQLLDPSLDPAGLPPGAFADRASLFAVEMRLLSLAIAAVTAHEIGHSLGLVAPGKPPHGLLGGVAGPWAVSAQDSHHIDTAGPNLMQTGASFNPLELLGDLPAFSPLEAGYLRRRLLVLTK